jgi:hypothetical protein
VSVGVGMGVVSDLVVEERKDARRSGPGTGGERSGGHWTHTGLGGSGFVCIVDLAGVGLRALQLNLPIHQTRTRQVKPAGYSTRHDTAPDVACGAKVSAGWGVAVLALRREGAENVPLCLPASSTPPPPAWSAEPFFDGSELHASIGLDWRNRANCIPATRAASDCNGS